MMKQRAAVAIPIGAKTVGPVLQRKCACGTHTVGGGQCDSCRKQAALKLGAADGEHEREAERVAAQVMRMRPGGFTSSPVRVQRKASHTGPAPEIDAAAEGWIRGAAGRGDHLPAPARAFLEPRFGRDFSQVRVYNDPDAASLAQRLDAEAFTVGHDIFFNAHRYNPSSREGMHLLAHELTHVAQQDAGEPTVLRRAKIPYRTLKWDDFKKTPPATGGFEAETDSGFEIPKPGWRRKMAATGKDCKLKGKPEKEYEATVFVDPSVFDSVEPLMNQDGSYVKAHLTDPTTFCSKTRANECQSEFDTKTQAADTQCKEQVPDCEQSFKDGKTSYKQKFNGVTVEAKSQAECSKEFVAGCKSAMTANLEFSLLDYSKAKYATAKKKTDCTDKSFQDPCVAHETALSAQLLKHEQGHFDISKVIAAKAKADLKTKASAFTATATACGQKAADEAAHTKFTALDAEGQVLKRGGEWIAKKDLASSDYDNDTDHGMKDKEQAAWVAKIAAGLTTYDLNPPPAAPTTTPPTGSGTPATPPTGSGAPAPAPKPQSTDTGTEESEP